MTPFVEHKTINNMEAEYIQECICGAVTVTFANGATNSMSRETFNKLGITGEHSPHAFCNCNHCVNHWGIDLCQCGSGQPVSKCKCGSNEPSEELGVKRKFVGWVF